MLTNKESGHAGLSRAQGQALACGKPVNLLLSRQQCDDGSGVRMAEAFLHDPKHVLLARHVHMDKPARVDPVAGQPRGKKMPPAVGVKPKGTKDHGPIFGAYELMKKGKAEP